MTLGVTPVPGTDAGYILSTFEETTDFLELPQIDLGDGLTGTPAVTALDQAIAEARRDGWVHDAGPIPVVRGEVADHPLYLTLLRRSRD